MGLGKLAKKYLNLLTEFKNNSHKWTVGEYKVFRKELSFVEEMLKEKGVRPWMLAAMADFKASNPNLNLDNLSPEEQEKYLRRVFKMKELF